jgi:hypothetical protein
MKKIIRMRKTTRSIGDSAARTSPETMEANEEAAEAECRESYDDSGFPARGPVDWESHTSCARLGGDEIRDEGAEPDGDEVSESVRYLVQASAEVEDVNVCNEDDKRREGIAAEDIALPAESAPDAAAAVSRDVIEVVLLIPLANIAQRLT